MRRIGFAVILTAFAVSLVAEAQPPTKVARVGMLAGASRSAVQWVAFEHRLRELGYVEGQNLILEFVSSEGHPERFPDLAAALVQRNLDVTGKRLEVLKEVVPQLTRVAVLWDIFSAAELPAAQAAAQRVSVKLQSIELRSRPYDYASAFSSAAAGRAEAVLPFTSPVFFLDRAASLRSWIPTVCQSSTTSGNLWSREGLWPTGRA